ncbi:MAG TPA: glycerol-3-phosphate dehydrogenase [Planctomycetota bacterium]
MNAASPDLFDLLVVGGGINGTGIARDASGRGLSVLLVEKGDLAGATSSASSKLIHGGLRYLETYEFRMVRQSLHERERLLEAAPHLVAPLRFVLPHGKGLRPRWILRAGLLLYDLFAGRSRLPRSAALEFGAEPLGNGLQRQFRHGFAYSDCWADDARLVVANARDAADRGAEVLVGEACISAHRQDGTWQVLLEKRGGPHDGERRHVRARALADVAGPWAAEFLAQVDRVPGGKRRGLRLVQGSHIVVPRLHAGRHAFLLQNPDKRIVFVIPFKNRWSLIGTTDTPLEGPPGSGGITAAEIDYLCRSANRWMEQQIGPEDVIWSYSGVRALVDDGSANPSKVTRDYKIDVEHVGGRAPLMAVFGGKLTSYRALAENAVDKLRPYFSAMGDRWTDGATLPGGNVPDLDLDAFVAELVTAFPDLPATLLRALAERHGSLCHALLGEAHELADLGRHFGGELYQREVDWMIEREWARAGEDVLWRRTKEGLRMDGPARQALVDYVSARRSG